VENFGVALEDAGGLSTKEVSVVLMEYNISLTPGEQSRTYINVVSPSKSPP
jgi:hypothetical protein